MYKLAIFDLDGTLLDTSRTIQSVLNGSLEKFSLPPISLEKTEEYVGNGARKLVERAVGKDSDELIKAVYAEYSKNFASCSNGLTKLYGGADECLRKLKDRGILLAIITNKPEDAARRVYREFLSRFDFCAVRGQAQNAPLKPDPTVTLEIIQSCGLKNEECLFVGDGETDVQTATNAGIDCVSVLWGFRTEGQLKSAGALRFVKNFDELAFLILGQENF